MHYLLSSLIFTLNLPDFEDQIMPSLIQTEELADAYTNVFGLFCFARKKAKSEKKAIKFHQRKMLYFSFFGFFSLVF